jgi:hypothetical protein
VTRRPPVWREGPFGPDEGRAAFARVADAVREGRSPGSVVGVTGLVVTPWVRDALDRGALHRLPVFDRITPDGVAWDDGRSVRADVLLWATGFRAALGHLAPLHLREPGGGIRMAGTRAAREPRLHLVGYGPSASTIGANRAGQAAARALRRALAPSARAGSPRGARRATAAALRLVRGHDRPPTYRTIAVLDREEPGAVRPEAPQPAVAAGV